MLLIQKSTLYRCEFSQPSDEVVFDATVIVAVEEDLDFTRDIS
jgi:hypothetical protein